MEELLDDKAMSTTFFIGTTKVTLTDFSPGSGEINISDPENYILTSYRWNAMGKGSDIRSFLINIDVSYFVKNLGDNTSRVINMKKTMANVRKEVKTHMSWYMDLEYQKNLRNELKRIERSATSEREFVDMMISLKHDSSLDPKYCAYRDEATYLIQALSSEPWYHAEVSKDNRTNVWLRNFFPKLIDKIKNGN